ncbi:MAG TPA: hypothetical protein VNM87_06945 [Candidatus Udaeobacter sp.]|nr:hypothetical protein [Candidatus Udaeobacter sp.]
MKRLNDLLGALLVAGAACVLTFAGSGCGEEPGPDDLLTVVEMHRPEAGDTTSVAHTKVTFRDWFNGGLVVEARMVPSAVIEALRPVLEDEDAEAEARAEAWSQVMAASTSGGFDERPLVGYQGLIRELDMVRPGSAAGTDSTSTLLVAYLADVEEIEREDQPDSLVITPLDRTAGILNDVSFFPGTQAP